MDPACISLGTESSPPTGHPFCSWMPLTARKGFRWVGIRTPIAVIEPHLAVASQKQFCPSELPAKACHILRHLALSPSSLSPALPLRYYAPMPAAVLSLRYPKHRLILGTSHLLFPMPPCSSCRIQLQGHFLREALAGQPGQSGPHPPSPLLYFPVSFPSEHGTLFDYC